MDINSASVMALLPVSLRSSDPGIDAFARGFTGDGLTTDLFSALVRVAERAVYVEVGESSSIVARARAVDSLLAGLRENLDMDLGLDDAVADEVVRFS